MVSDQKLIYKDKEYKIIKIEQEFIVHPAALGILPLSKSAICCNFTAEYYLDGYNLYLEKLKTYDAGSISRQYQFYNCRVSYNGAILIAADLVNDYRMKGSQTVCFSYQNVKELVFDDGILVTSIDQNRAMYRIRKNLELGLRNLNNSKDLRCINRFLDSAFVGDYKPFRFAYSRQRYINEMKNLYDKEKPVYTLI